MFVFAAKILWPGARVAESKDHVRCVSGRQRPLIHCSRLRGRTLIGSARMFGRFAIGCITTAIIFVATIERSSGAAAAFSDDGNHVYLLGSKLPKGTVLDVDLINFTTTKFNLGVSTEVQGIANAPRALLFVTDRSLYRLPLPSGEVGKICDAPTGVTFEDVACNRAQHGILLLCHGNGKNYREWPAYYLREQERKPTSLVLRRVNALVGAVFDRDGHLFFASGGDIWEGDISKPTEPEELLAVEADRFAPVQLVDAGQASRADAAGGKRAHSSRAARGGARTRGAARGERC